MKHLHLLAFVKHLSDEEDAYFIKQLAIIVYKYLQEHGRLPR